MALGDPADHMQIPQAAWAVLDVGFKGEGGFIIFMATTPPFVLFGFKKRAIRPNTVRAGHRPHLLQ